MLADPPGTSRLQPDGASSGDYTITVGPGARAVAPIGRRAAVALWDEIDYAMFASESDLNSINNAFRSKLHVYFKDVTLFSHVDQRSFRERPNDEVDLRLRHNTTRFKFGATYRPARRGEIRLYADRTDESFTSRSQDVPAGIDPSQARALGDLVARTLNRSESFLGMEGRLRILSRTSLLFDVETGIVEFDNRLPERDASTVNSMLGLEFDPSGPFRGFLKLGVRRLQPDQDRLEGFSGPIADANLSAKLMGRGHVKATYKRNTIFSGFGDNLFYLQESRGLAYEHYINRRFSLELGRSFSDSRYPEPVANKHRHDDIVTDMLTIRYQMGPGLRIGLSLRRWDRDSNFNAVDATRNTISTMLEYTP